MVKGGKVRVKKRLLFLVCLVILAGMATYTLHERGNVNKTILVLDSANTAALPANFRMTSSPIPAYSGTYPNLLGLSELKASGSSQFSAKGLQKIRRAIGTVPITVVDLRQESHGFVNGNAVSWYGKNNEANLGLTLEEVLRDEQAKLRQLARTKVIVVNRPGKTSKPPLRIPQPATIQSEAELVQSQGLAYMRIPVTDHHLPIAQEVDRFIRFVTALPKGEWLHFHCHAGVGRTTVFLIMYDMMRNAKRVGWDDIIQRQILLGGKGVIRNFSRGGRHTIATIGFLQHFYLYCQANRDNFRTSWTQWLQQNPLPGAK